MAKSNKVAAVVVAEKANTKARRLRALIRKSRTKDVDKLIAKAMASDIGIPQANIKRYVVNNLERIAQEKQAA